MMAAGYDNTLTISPMANIGQHNILRLDSALDMDAFDHDLNFEGDNILYLLSFFLLLFI